MQVLSQVSHSEKIRRINDACRRSFTGCRIVVTAAFAELDAKTKAIVLHQVQTFKDFDEGNDPHHEHDFGCIEHDGEKFFFKFDYYDETLQYGSDDPSDQAKTRRVLTIMLASDY